MAEKVSWACSNRSTDPTRLTILKETSKIKKSIRRNLNKILFLFQYPTLKFSRFKIQKQRRKKINSSDYLKKSPYKKISQIENSLAKNIKGNYLLFVAKRGIINDTLV